MRHFILGLVLCLMASPAFAGRVTHLMGTAGYMVREARIAGAAKKAPADYAEALKYQRLARKAFRGESGKGRNPRLAADYARKAYDSARKARDASQPWPYEGSKDNFLKSTAKAPEWQ